MVWAVAEPQRLTRPMVKAIQQADVLYVSAITAWEIVQLAERGRVSLEGDPMSWVARAMGQLGAVPLPVTFEIGMEAARLAYEHRDPADRFLIATARTHDLKLNTADRRIQTWSGVKTVH